MNEELKEKLKYCRLAGIAEVYDELVKESAENGWDNETFFKRLIECEVISRENNRFERLMSKTRFPNLKTIDQFDFNRASNI